ncbi:hypothetical protein PHYC_01984 [Phycisphaerales bacterium]|nr:hypothetical protein PHYC_01984 [Phycisphaerales bacterium]
MRIPIIVLSCLALAPIAAADSISLQASKDNTLYEDLFGGISNGRGQYMFAGATQFQVQRRALIAFDVSAIPAGSTVTAARLTLHMSRTISTGEPVAVHRSLTSWGEGASTGLLEEGQGAPAEPGDATWLHRFFPNDFWSTPGGEFDPAPNDSILISEVGFYSWGLGGQLVADVQHWLDQPTENFGWFMIGNEGNPASAKRFDTREHIEPAFRPVLEVEYTPIPGPGFSAFFSATLFAATRRRRPA